MTALRAGSAPSGPERPDRLSSRYYTLRFSLRHELDEIARITPAVSDYLASCKVPEATGFKVHLTLEEMLSNLVRHGDGNAPIDVAIAADEDRVILRIEDDGTPFDPRQVPAPDVEAPLEDRRCGGMGIHLVRSLSARMEYRRRRAQPPRRRHRHRQRRLASSGGAAPQCGEGFRRRCARPSLKPRRRRSARRTRPTARRRRTEREPQK